MTTAKVAADVYVLVYQIWLRNVKGGRVMTIYVFSKWRPAAILDFHKVKFEGISVSGTSVFLSQPNFVSIYAITTELWPLK